MRFGISQEGAANSSRKRANAAHDDNADDDLLFALEGTNFDLVYTIVEAFKSVNLGLSDAVGVVVMMVALSVDPGYLANAAYDAAHGAVGLMESQVIMANLDIVGGMYDGILGVVF
jgi:hypothetical protein